MMIYQKNIKNTINDTMLSFILFDNLTDDETREMFKRLNNGKPLSAKARTLANTKDIEKLLEIGEHPLFEELPIKHTRENIVTIVSKSWLMLNEPIGISFEGQRFFKQVENIMVTQEEAEQLKAVFDYIVTLHDTLPKDNELTAKKPTILIDENDAENSYNNKNESFTDTDVAKRLYTETHLVSLVPFIWKAVNEKKDAQVIAEWLISFFTSNNKKYQDASMQGSAKSQSIKDRNDELQKSWDGFFK